MDLDRVKVADCRTWLAEISADSIDLLMTSPPYWSPQSSRSFPNTLECIWDGNPGCRHEWSSQGRCTNCGAWSGELGLEPSREMYVAHLLSIFRIIKKVLKPTGSFYLNLGDPQASTLRRRSGDNGEISSRIEQGMFNDGWLLVDKSTWRRPDLSSGEESRSKYSYELLFHFVKNRKIRLWHNVETREWVEKKPSQRYRNLKTDVGIKWNKLRTTMPAIMKTPIENMTQQKLEERRLWRQIWQPFAYYYDLDSISGIQGGRTAAGISIRVGDAPKTRIAGPQFEAFPEEFCIRPILSSCPPEGIVADPFTGSGTTLIIAKKLGRHYIGCDLNSDYVQLARKRLSDVERSLSQRDPR